MNEKSISSCYCCALVYCNLYDLQIATKAGAREQLEPVVKFCIGNCFLLLFMGILLSLYMQFSI